MRSATMIPAAGTAREPGFRGLICASFGGADALGEGHNDGRPRHHMRFESADPENLSHLKSVLEEASVGVRLVLAGPPADIHAAAATAAKCGLLEEELTLMEDDGPRVVFCARCRTVTETVQAVGSEVDCLGCATTLAFSGHFSRRIGAYLGFAAHAEEAA